MAEQQEHIVAVDDDDNIYDTLRSAIKRLGGTKKIGALLWPEKTQADARGFLDDCLNKERPAKLAPDQVVLILKWARQANYHDAMNFICASAGYDAPRPLDPAVQEERLALVIEHASQTLASALQQLHELRARGGAKQLKSVNS